MKFRRHSGAVALVCLLILLAGLSGYAQTYSRLLAPPKMQFFDGNGLPCSGCLLYTYQAGTTTPLATYTDATGTVQNQNPVQLDASGFATVFLKNQAYQLKLTTFLGVPIYTVDNYAAGDANWIRADGTNGPFTGNFTWSGNNTYSGSSTFSGSTTFSTGELYGRVRVDNTDVALGLNALSTQARDGSLANVAVGFGALQHSASPSADNTAVGAYALNASASNGGNTALGTLGFQFLTVGSDNVCVGYQCGQTVTNTSNTVGVGAAALMNLTLGVRDTALGTHAQLSETTGNDNTCVGFECLVTNLTGVNNVALGNFALNNLVASSDNTAIGPNALYYTTGGFNTAVGFQSGVTGTAANANVTGQFNTFIGYNSGPASTTQLSDAAALGENALVNCSNCMVLGGTGGDAVKVGIATASPAQPLDVVGNVRSSTGFIIGAGTTPNATQTVGTGSVTTAGTLIASGSAQAQTAITVTGALTSDSCIANLGAALPATWQTGIQFRCDVTGANTATVNLINGTAAGITPAATAVAVRVIR